LGGAH